MERDREKEIGKERETEQETEMERFSLRSGNGFFRRFRHEKHRIKEFFMICTVPLNRSTPPPEKLRGTQSTYTPMQLLLITHIINIYTCNTFIHIYMIYTHEYICTYIFLSKVLQIIRDLN